MRTLVLGGTLFLGRAVVEAALERGHEVSIFTRGQTNPGLFPEVERLRGDRDGDLSALGGREWDAVVDTSGYVPRVVGAPADALAPSGFYAFVSSVSVYADMSSPPDESSATATLDEETEEVTGASYGALKAACERVVGEAFPGRSLAVRAGLIVGPHDPTGRFTYWVTRVARGGEVLAPEPRDLAVQFVDARDLGAWIVRMAEEGRGGTFNATGPPGRVTMEALLETCRVVSGSDAGFVWASPEFLRAHEVREWSELPLWIADPAYAGMHRAEVSAALAAGLAFRPLEETVRDTLAWATDPGAEEPSRKQGAELPPAGLAPEREAELLEAWARG